LKPIRHRLGNFCLGDCSIHPQGWVPIETSWL